MLGDIRERVATRWDPPCWPDNPKGLNPDSSLGREFAALQRDQAARLAPTPDNIRGLRDQVEYLRGVVEDDDATDADVREAQRQLRFSERDLERAEQRWFEKQQARMQASLQAGEAFEQRWREYLSLRQEHQHAAAIAYAEEQNNSFTRRGREGRDRLAVKLETLAGPEHWYRARVEEQLNASVA